MQLNTTSVNFEKIIFSNKSQFQIREGLVSSTAALQIDSAEDLKTFASAVIDHKSFLNIKGYLDHAKQDPTCEILTGGECDDR